MGRFRRRDFLQIEESEIRGVCVKYITAGVNTRHAGNMCFRTAFCCLQHPAVNAHKPLMRHSTDQLP